MAVRAIPAAGQIADALAFIYARLSPNLPAAKYDRHNRERPVMYLFFAIFKAN